MTTYLQINKQTNIVENIIEWDGVSSIPHLIENHFLQKEDGDIGWKWNGTRAIDTNPPKPAPIIKTGLGTPIKKL